MTNIPSAIYARDIKTSEGRADSELIINKLNMFYIIAIIIGFFFMILPYLQNRFTAQTLVLALAGAISVYISAIGYALNGDKRVVWKKPRRLK